MDKPCTIFVQNAPKGYLFQLISAKINKFGKTY